MGSRERGSGSLTDKGTGVEGLKDVRFLCLWPGPQGSLLKAARKVRNLLMLLRDREENA